MTTDGGGWTVFQRRDYELVNFTRGWQDHKTGFGNLNGEFWLGLEKVYRLTKRQVTKLRIDLEAPTGNKGYAVYSSFSISDESDFYRLGTSGYSGTAGDALANSSNSYWIANNRRFSTFDKDNDACSCNCAQGGKYGWWWGWCSISGLNGKAWDTFGQTIFRTEMKLK
ncbi:fibrinogen-like protein A [Actinia tenebrosa]|uniref:Fibrinogen-like protein A n=1 Tax=Actinia tenebrosa TaxID=6105 RepID=A0A6P8H323_ACTTE|nr:fibrinogen-like protein A [Actinia tenebrosa]